MEEEQGRLQMHRQQHHHQLEQAEQLSRAHIQSLQQQVSGFPADSCPSGMQPTAFGGDLYGHQHTQHALVGSSMPAAAVSGQMTAFGGFHTQQPTIAPPPFPGFSGAKAPSSAASRPMSAWPHDQQLASAVSLGACRCSRHLADAAHPRAMWC